MITEEQALELGNCLNNLVEEAKEFLNSYGKTYDFCMQSIEDIEATYIIIDSIKSSLKILSKNVFGEEMRETLIELVSLMEKSNRRNVKFARTLIDSLSLQKKYSDIIIKFAPGGIG